MTAEYEIFQAYQNCIHCPSAPPSLELLSYKGNMDIVQTSTYLTGFFFKLVGITYAISSVLVKWIQGNTDTKAKKQKTLK